MEFLDNSDDDNSTSEAEKKLLVRLEKYFLGEGLSRFSSRAAVAYFQVLQFDCGCECTVTFV